MNNQEQIQETIIRVQIQPQRHGHHNPEEFVGIICATYNCDILVSLSSLWHSEAHHKSQCVGQTHSTVAVTVKQLFM